MRIGLDARSIGNRVCGVSRTTSCLIKALSEIDKDNEYVVYTDLTPVDLGLGQNFKVCSTYCSSKNLVQDIKLYSILKRDRLDLYHVMHSWLPQIIPRGVKTIVTIHDTFSITDTQFFIKYKPFHKWFQLYFKFLTKRTVNKANVVITVSNYCKNELIKNFPILDGKIYVIYNASGIVNSADPLVKKDKVIDGNYLLYVGNCRSYKNIELLIEGFYGFLQKSKNPDLKLVVAGNDVYDVIKERAKKLGISERISFLTNPSDDDIKNLYANSTAFIMPSKYEGFGIPVLEAMSFGVPVIISNADALVEVVGNAGLIFDRDSPEELALAIEKIISDSNLKDTFIEKGYERVKRYSWVSSAQQLKLLYEGILKKDN